MLSYGPIAITLFVIAASVSPIGCQNEVDEVSNRIWFGEDTTIEKHPHQVSLHEGVNFVCGGSIISDYYVLTAAHCLIDYNPSYLRAGSTYLNRGGHLHWFESTVYHKDYQKNEEGVPVHDIGLIRVTKPFKYDSTTRRIWMFQTGEITPANARATTTGWGGTEHGSPSVLQEVTIPIVDKNTCNNAHEPRGGLPKGQICAGGREGTCHGDSGGPLIIEGKIAGITSWGVICGSPEYPVVFTEVAYYYEWIEKKMKQYNVKNLQL